mmetsp:Transcript_24960/g.98600  ORF Transcript_24960/g.98600 Transcript_24960/m.98600 type:complete len:99 (-) Transcript_24960:2986-3282(-)
MVSDVAGGGSACEDRRKETLIPADLEKAVSVRRIGNLDKETEMLGTNPHLQCVRDTRHKTVIVLGTTGDAKSTWKIEAKTCCAYVEVQWCQKFFRFVR